jgi:hypothetical protein
VNYIVEAARTLLRDKRLTEALGRELGELVGQYEEAMKSGEDESAIDSLEDRLLEKIEEAKETLEEIG